MEEKERRFAVLIDADNVSPKYISYILDEVSDLGIATYKRIYGDWTDNSKKSWKEALLEWSVNPIQQYSYTTGKNATDSALIIDAMDILYSGNVDGYCLVSSDSDFTKLAQRLREDGIFVVGMGERKTPKPFIKACDTFKILEVIAQEDEEKVEITDLGEIETAISKIVTENSNQGKQTSMGEIGNVLAKKFSDFDVRNYGYTKLSTLLESLKDFGVSRAGNNYLVTEKKPELTREELKHFIEGMIQKNHGQVDNLGYIYEEIRKAYPGFQVKQYGYSRVSSFIRSFQCFQIEGNMVRMKQEKKG